MSEPIKVGDLVIVVGDIKCRCNFPSRYFGLVFRVSRIKRYFMTYCQLCKGDVGEATLCFEDGEDSGFATYRLKRIPPLEELDDVKQDEEITA
jgi:hypothetical protein